MATIATSRSWWLEYNNSSVVTHTSKTSRVGGLGRTTNTPYVSETILIFDLSSFAGQTVTSATLTGILSGWDGGRTSDCNIIARVQNKKRRVFWNDAELPRYDDFNSVTGIWDTSLSGVLLPKAGTGTVIIPTAPGLVSEIQSQIDGVPNFWESRYDKNWNDGIILTATTDYWSYYNDFSSWKLDINTTSPVVNNDYYYRNMRG